MKRSVSVAAAAMLFTAHAWAVTFDFTGTVTSTEFGFDSIPYGTAVSGTFTFDPSQADPALSSGSAGVPGSTLERSLTAPDTATILSDVITVGTYTFESSYTLPDGNRSSATYGLSGSLALSELGSYGSGNEFSDITLLPASDGTFAYSSDGMPVFQGSGTGDLGCSCDGYVDFTITSMGLVPLPDTLWLMVGGLLLPALTARPANFMKR